MDAAPLDLKGVHVAFDLDGTLADTAPDLVGALNAAIAQDNLPPVDLEHVRQLIGYGARALLRRAYAHNHIGLPEHVLDDRVGAFLDHYAQHVCVQTTLYPGMKQALDALIAAGARLSVATNKPDALAVPVIEGLGVADRFDRIIGATSAPKRKPHAAHIRAAVGAGVDPERVVMVGDSVPDVGAARAFGARVIVMDDGYTRIPADRLGADAVLVDAAALPGAVARLMARVDA